MPKKTINLFEKTPLEKETGRRKFFGWLSTGGKALIIGTNIVTIAAFAFRVKTDQEKIDLMEKVSIQERIVEAGIPFETVFNDFQNKVQILKKATDSKNLLENIEAIQKTIPEDVVVKAITAKQDKLSVYSQALSGTAMAAMITNLMSEKLGSVVLNNATINPENTEKNTPKTYDFELTIQME